MMGEVVFSIRSKRRWGALCHVLNLCAARSRALAISSSRLLGGAFVSSEPSRFRETAVIPSTAARNAASLALEGLLNPLTFLTNCSDAARISSSVTGGAKLKRILMFLHMSATSRNRIIYPARSEVADRILRLLQFQLGSYECVVTLRKRSRLRLRFY